MRCGLGDGTASDGGDKYDYISDMYVDRKLVPKSAFLVPKLGIGGEGRHRRLYSFSTNVVALSL